jgi:hypothetical protein
MNDAQFHYEVLVMLVMVLTVLVVISVALANIASSLRNHR